MCRRILSDDEIKRALTLKREGMTFRDLAQEFEVGLTTIFENIKGREEANRKRLLRAKTAILTWRSIKSVCIIIRSYKSQGHTSKEISDLFNIPLQDVNYLWTKNI